MKFKTAWLLLMVFLCSSPTNAQHYFNKIYGPSEDKAYSSGRLMETPSGYLVVGHANTQYGVELYVTKLDLDGSEISTTIIDTGNIFGWEAANTGLKTFDGNYVFYGNIRPPEGMDYMRLYKVNEHGELLWSRSYICPDMYCARPIPMIIETSDHNLIWAGAYRSQNELGQNTSTTSTFVMKTNHVGDILWEHILGEPQYAEMNKSYGSHGGACLELPDGNILIVRGSYELAGNSQAAGSQKIVLTELDASLGTELNEVVFDSWTYQMYPTTLPYDDDHFILSVYGPEENDGQGDHRWGIAKMTYDLEIVWERLYDNVWEPDSFYNLRTGLSRGMALKPDGGFLAAFAFKKWHFTDEMGIMGEECRIAEFDADGNWTRSIPLYKDPTIITYDAGNNAAGLYDFAYDLDRTSDGGYIATGTRYGHGTFYKSWVVKLDSNLQQCHKMDCDSTAAGTPVVEVASNLMTVSTYPNPSSGTVSLDFTTPLQQSAELQVYNLEGKRLLAELLPAGAELHQLDLGKYGSGIYLWELRTDGTLLQNGRLIIDIDR